MQIQINYNGSTFVFSRDSFGVGRWYCTRGKCPGILGMRSSGKAVPLSFAPILNEEALRQGLITSKKELFWTKKVEEKREKKLRRVKASKKVAPFEGFNPFR